MQRTYYQLDLNDRRKLARWRGMGLSVDVIAEKLGRHRSTIFRELRRNVFIDQDWPELDGYHCVMAHDMARERRTRLQEARALLSCPPAGHRTASGRLVARTECWPNAARASSDLGQL